MSPIFSRFQQAANKSPTKTALITPRGVRTYGELEREATVLSSSLAKAGIKCGDHVGVVLPNGVEFVLLMLAAARLGVVLVPQSMGLPAEAVARTFRAADVRHLIAWHSLVSDLTTCFSTDADAGKRVWISVGESITDCLTFDDLIQDDGDALIVSAEFPVEQPYLLVLTSGSTGEPKPIVLSQKAKMDRAHSVAELYGVTNADVTLAATPLYHTLAQRLVMLPLLTGGTCVLLERYTPASWIEAVEQNGVSFTIAVSAQLKHLLEDLRAHHRELRSLRCLVSSSALLDTDTKRQLLDILQCDFHECYGTSEVAIATDLSPQAGAARLGSVGKAIPGVTVAVIDEEGNSLPPDTPGEIVCRTRLRFSGYYAQPEATEAAMWDDYFRTGDVGKLDRDGYLYFLGRTKDIIITGGINVYPKDIEDVIAVHEKVRECAAIPVPHVGLGEVVGVVLAVDAGAEDLKLREVRRLCAVKLADFQQPHHLFVVHELPKNRMGKVNKPALKARFSKAE